MAEVQEASERAMRAATGLRRRAERLREREALAKDGLAPGGLADRHGPHVGSVANWRSDWDRGAHWGGYSSSSFIEDQVEGVRRAFAGMRLEDVYELTPQRTAMGSVLRILQASRDVSLKLPASGSVRSLLHARLDLVRGIGRARSAALRAAGTMSVPELTDPVVHPSYAAEAEAFLAEMLSGDVLAVVERLRRRLGSVGHLLASLLAATVQPEEIGFLDVETLGLDNNMIFLVGVGRLRGDSFFTEQFLAPSPADEPAALCSAMAALEGVRVLVTYNGRAADVPWIRNRCFYHGLVPPPEIAHLDLVYGTRRRWRMDEELLPDARLPTVQEILLGGGRPSHDVPSYLVPDLYSAYTSSPEDEGLLVPVIDHNRSDIEALCVLLELLCTEAAGRYGPLS